ncbi:MAG: hypothetical protein IKF93_05930 [Lachnospiraceae bacterium]|nr:hypothetical protein [Lachnospiraceae bacterium]
MDEKRICEQYIKRVKILFPYVGKTEKKYLDNLRLNAEDFCDNENIISLSELEKGFGKPEDIVHEYISSVETDELIKRLNTKKLIKCIIFCVLILVVAVATFFAIYTYKEYKIVEESAIFFEDVTIE